MADSLRGMPRYLRNTDTGWQGADHPDGPWRPIPAPQDVSALWGQQPTPTEPSYSDRLALALCADRWPSLNCQQPCRYCRHNSVAMARELAQILRERHGGSSFIMERWGVSQPQVSRRLAAINGAPPSAGLGRVERLQGAHGWWRVTLPATTTTTRTGEP